MQWRAGGVERR